MRFSQRIGKVAIDVPIQIEDISPELRNGIWNGIYICFLKDADLSRHWKSETLGIIAHLGHLNFFKLPVDELHEYGDDYIAWLKKWFFGQPWLATYDYVDWLANYGAFWKAWQPGQDRYDSAVRFRQFINKVLEKENSVYRFVDQHLAEVSNEHEVDEIEKAIKTDGFFSPVSMHISAAVKLMSDRVEPDFRNSIKESISAVESAAKIVTGNSSATLGDALKTLGREGELHPALRDAFFRLYGWTSDAEGIRHSMLEQSKLDLADARFMLIACSAFSNFLIDKSKTGS
ncbi:MAG: hypothetical protein J7562_12900 [Agrobacterium tumefaciens]|nr:hypothetical protein [Agrobacterium tumefaciens]